MKRNSGGRTSLLRLVEYSEILTNLNDETIAIDTSFYKGPFKAVSAEEAYLKDWRLYFKQEDPLHFELKGFEVVKTLIQNQLGIFSSRRRYEILETSMETLIKFMKKNYMLKGQEDMSPDSSPLRLKQPSKGDISDSKLTFKAPTDDVQLLLKSLNISYGMDLSQNYFLGEYFLVMRKRLTSLFMCSIVDNQDIFIRKEDAVANAMRSTLGLVPVVGSFLKMAGIMMGMIQDANLKRKLTRISDLAINYADFPEKISRLMTLLRSNAIMGSVDVGDALKKSNIISDALYKLGLAQQMTPPELLAFNDSKIVEGALLALIETKQINVVHFPDINELQCKLVNFLLETHAIRLSFDVASSTREKTEGNISPTAMVYTEVIIDKEILAKNDYLPKSLLRKKNEEYGEYYNRINKYLKVFPTYLGFDRRKSSRFIGQNRSSQSEV